MTKILNLYDKLEGIDISEFSEMDREFFLEFSKISSADRPEYITAFMVLSNWWGNSRRPGVWTYYELADAGEMQITSRILKQMGATELEHVFSSGIQDYQNPIYEEKFEYPEEWDEAAEEIDDWIAAHEQSVWELQLTNQEDIKGLFTEPLNAANGSKGE